MQIVYQPKWLDDDAAWRGIYVDSEFVPVSRAERIRGFNVMRLDILRRHALLKSNWTARSRLSEIAGNWLKSEEGLPKCLLAEIVGARYEENLEEITWNPDQKVI